MPTVEINNQYVHPIGDPHLGKSFINGVPLERRGQREEFQKATFKAELFAPKLNDKIKTVICMGDLFDQFRVSNNILVDTWKALDEASVTFPSVDYYILMGNHDISRNVNLVSSFDILSIMLSKRKNIHFITKNTWVKTGSLIFLLCPYSAFEDSVTAFKNTEEYYQTHKGYITAPLELDAVFGHWDIESFGGSDHNLVPYKELAAVTKKIFTGHIHTPSKFMIDQQGNKSTTASHCEVTVVGSMLPYSHGEDPTEIYYVTRTLEEYQNQIDSEGSHAFSAYALRLLLKPGEEMPENVSAMQITYKYVDVAEKEEVQVTLSKFSFENVFKEVMEEHNVSEDLTKETWTRYKELNTDDTEA